MSRPLQIYAYGDAESFAALPDPVRAAATWVSAIPETIPEALAVACPEGADLVLVEWDAVRAPLIGALCSRVREAACPIIALCATRDEFAQALLAGPDAAVVAPFVLPEIQATLVACRWRMRPGPDPVPTTGAIVESGPIQIDDRRKRVTMDGEEIPLTPRLYDLLLYLARREGEVVGRDDLLASVWGLEFDPSTNVVDVYVHYLRRALSRAGVEGAVRTVRGRGYAFDTEAARGL